MGEGVGTVAVLFARADSVYKALPGTDVYDIDRDARTWPGGAPVVAHPPCRGWGRLAYFAKPAPGELELGPWAAERVRRWGGVLEHPAHSKLWPAARLPAPREVDAWGGLDTSSGAELVGPQGGKAHVVLHRRLQAN